MGKILFFLFVTIIPDENKSFSAKPWVTYIDLAFYKLFTDIYE